MCLPAKPICYPNCPSMSMATATATPSESASALALAAAALPRMQMMQQLPKIKKSVRFNQTVHVAPYERATTQEAQNVWYSNVEVASMKAHGREMAASYRKLGGDAKQTSSEEYCYRGFEGYTFVRQRQRLLSNRCAVYAHKQGFDAETTAVMYKQANQWSSDVAFVQAVHDFVNVYSSENISSAKNSAIPSVATMVPPPDMPFAVRGFVFMQGQRKSKIERKLKRRQATAGIRRVRQRVC